MNINEVVVSKLINMGYSISFAESCTGGMCASSIIDVSDASKVINESYITYSNEAKSRILNVDKDILLTNGAVSNEVAKEMAYGLFEVSKSNICISITGIAGPKGGTLTKPVGLVCFGFLINNKYYAFSNVFENKGRDFVRKSSVLFVLNKLNKLL